MSIFGTTIHVSHDGAVPATGEKAVTVTTLSDARDALRTARSRGAPGPYRVLISPGVFRVSKPLELTGEDGGSRDEPVVWESTGGGDTVIDGGMSVSGWIRPRTLPVSFPKASHGHIWKASVPVPRLCSRLYWDGKPLRWATSEADDDWRGWRQCQLGDRPDSEVIVDEQLDSLDLRSAVLNYMPTPYTRWSNAYARITGAYPGLRLIRHATFALPRPERTLDIPYRFENLPNGLTNSGVWYLDLAGMNVYLWPPDDEDPNHHETVLPGTKAMFRLVGSESRPLRHLTIRGFEIAHSGGWDDESLTGFGAVGAAITIDRAESCVVERCRIHGLDGNAISGGPYVRHLEIAACEIFDAGGAGVVLRGISGGRQFPCSENRITDNVVRHCGDFFWHSAGISLSACERSEVSHNLVHHMPYIGIGTGGGPRHTYFRGWPRQFPELEALWKAEGSGEPTIDAVKTFIPGNNRIEKNIVHHVMRVLDDGAAIYCHAGHHESVISNIVYAIESPMGMGLYFDDEQMDSLMEGNLAYRCPEHVEKDSHSSVLHLHHNGRNTVVNNIMIGRAQVLSIPNGYGGHVLERNIFVWEREPDWDRADPVAVTGPGDGRRQEGWGAGPSVARNNLWWHADGEDAAARLLSEWKTRGYGNGSVAADPGIRDLEHGEISDDSSAFDVGFVRLDVHDAGPRR